MAEPRRPQGTDQVAAALRELGGRLDVPPAPDVRAAVRARLAAGTTPARVRAARAGRADRVAQLAAALVAFAVLLGSALAFSPRARAAVVEICTFGAVRIHTGEPAPWPPPGAHPGGPRFGGLPPGTRETSLAAARQAASFPVRVPATLGRPDQVLIRGTAEAGFVALRYGPGDGRPPPAPGGLAIELDEFAGSLPPYLDKYVQAGQAVRVRVGSDDGLWIDTPHEVTYLDPAGRYQVEPARLAGRTLLWQHAGVTYRLEGELSRDAALAIARSLQ
jgi:hypothetical protein